MYASERAELRDHQRGDLAGDALEDERTDEGQRLRHEGAHALAPQEGAREARPGLGVRLAVGEHVDEVGVLIFTSASCAAAHHLETVKHRLGEDE